MTTPSVSLEVIHSTHFAPPCRQSDYSVGFNDRFIPYVLRNQSTSATFEHIKHRLDEEHGIPFAIQSHFKSSEGYVDQYKTPPEVFTDSDPVSAAYQPDLTGEGVITVSLVTYAGYLDEMRLDNHPGSIVAAMKQWRYYTTALKYLHKSFGSTEEADAKDDLKEKIQEYEELEKRWSASVRKQLTDWNVILYGYADSGGDDTLRFTRFLADRHRFEQRNTQPCAVVSKPLREKAGHLSMDSNSFNVNSGVLLWGQLQSVFAGSRTDEFQQNASSVPEMIPGGTIRQHVHKYRSAARKGRWIVRKALSDYGGLSFTRLGQPTSHFGWIICHEDIDPLETIQRCSRINITNAISNGNKHVDKDILYIGRYDWSHHLNPRAIGRNFSSDFDNFINMATGSSAYGSSRYMLALDADGFCPAFLDCFKRVNFPLAECTERIFHHPNRQHSMEGFGALVAMPETEYEFGWLVFSGNKHPDFPEADELVAIIYDGSYAVLEGCTFAVESERLQPDHEHEADSSQEGDRPETLNNLLAAIERNDIVLVEAILASEDSDTKLDASWYENALETAVWLGNTEIVKALLERDATMDGGVYTTCLQTSAYMGHEAIAHLLLQRGANVNVRCGLYGTALQAAAWAGHQTTVQILCNANADVNAEGGRFTYPLIAAVYSGNNNIVHLLIDRGADVNASARRGNALQAASLMGYSNIVDSLLDEGADPNAEGGQYGSALQAATYGGHKDVVLTLLERGANVSPAHDSATGECGSALHAAVCQGYRELAGILLGRGADPNAESGKYGNALHAAMSSRDRPMFDFLLEAGADVHGICGDYGNTLDAAINLGWPEFVEMLMDRGAWPSQPIRTPMMNVRNLLHRRGVGGVFDN